MQRLARQPRCSGAFVATFASLMSALSLASPSLAQCGYDAEVMPWPQGYMTMFVNDMNEAGVIVGHRRVQGGSLLQSAFRWSAEEGYVTLPPPPTGASEWDAVQIDEEGNIVGTADLPGSPTFYEIVRWPSSARGGGVQLLSPGTSVSSYWTETLLPDGSVVGYIQNGEMGFYPRAYWWRDGEFLPIPEPLASTDSSFRCAHPSGWAGGEVRLVDRTGEVTFKSVLWSPGQSLLLYDLFPSPQYWNEQIVALDRQLRACVLVREDIPDSLSHPSRTYFWDGATLTPIGPHTGTQWTTGANMNELGQVVGRTGVIGGSADLFHAFLWQNGVFVHLSTLTTLPPNVKISWGLKPLNNGVILCEGTVGNKITGIVLRPQTVAEDVNVDCQVDGNDLSFVLSEWGPIGAGSVRRADVNSDGFVDAHDLAAVLGAWSVETR